MFGNWFFVFAVMFVSALSGVFITLAVLDIPRHEGENKRGKLIFNSNLSTARVVRSRYTDSRGNEYPYSSIDINALSEYGDDINLTVWLGMDGYPKLLGSVKPGQTRTYHVTNVMIED